MPRHAATTAQVSQAESQQARDEKQLALFFIGLEMLGEKKKYRFLLYLASLKKTEQQNQEGEPDEF